MYGSFVAEFPVSRGAEFAVRRAEAVAECAAGIVQAALDGCARKAVEWLSMVAAGKEHGGMGEGIGLGDSGCVIRDAGSLGRVGRGGGNGRMMKIQYPTGNVQWPSGGREKGNGRTADRTEKIGPTAFC